VSLLALLPLAVKLLGENLDLLGSIINIMKSYVLLDASQVFQVRLIVAVIEIVRK